MRALCMCLVLLLSSCASVDQWAKATFTPSPYEGIYSMDENGFPIPIMVPYTGINFDHEFEEPQVKDAQYYNRDFQQRRKAFKNNTLYNNKELTGL
jgi:major membrane immunogen (membrane-anchored lipoprotein)